MAHDQQNEQAAWFAIAAVHQQTGAHAQAQLQRMQQVGLLESLEAVLYFESPTQMIDQLRSTSDQYLQCVRNIFVDRWDELLARDGKRRAFYLTLLRLSNLKNVFFIALTPPAQEYLDSLLLQRNPPAWEHLSFFTGYNRTRIRALGRDVERSYKGSLHDPANFRLEPFWKYRLAVDWIPQSDRHPLTDWHNQWTTEHSPRLTQLVKQWTQEIEMKWIQTFRTLQGLPADPGVIHWIWTEEWAAFGRFAE
ncbi:hypothetical protein BU16DRAFT_554188 [Lophium mytilinum]|uniref:Uncharacterized protein n=1 Tax=Lophium mytilinum TaxID=390894 RepID=A0A6A6RF84_9PEZI|nr:hypothetical protein BU16DRAFT_554188 [Lophium mytilinum]